MTADADQIIGLYRRHAAAWDRLRGLRFDERGWIDRFLALLPEARTVLDIGCGSGRPIGKYFLDAGVQLTGVDASPELIAMAKANLPEAEWHVADMRELRLGARFSGLVAWHSSFHLTPEGQRRLFDIFEKHAAPGALLLFTSGPREGEAIGSFEGERLYHASLDPEEYARLLAQHGFEVVERSHERPHGSDEDGHIVWLARYRRSPD